MIGQVKYVTTSFAEKVIQDKDQKGIFITFENQEYIVIDNRNGEAKTKKFPNLQQAFEWARLIVEERREDTHGNQTG